MKTFKPVILKFWLISRKKGLNSQNGKDKKNNLIISKKKIQNLFLSKTTTKNVIFNQIWHMQLDIEQKEKFLYNTYMETSSVIISVKIIDASKKCYISCEKDQESVGLMYYLFFY